MIDRVEQVLTVQESVDGQIRITGTKHSLGMLEALIHELLKFPEDKVIQALSARGEIIVRLQDEEVSQGVES